MGFASETNSNPEMDKESVLEFELDEATSETDLTSDDDIYEYDLSLPGNKIPKWFNHQSVGSSISFLVGQKLPKFVFCVALKVESKVEVPYKFDKFNCSIYVYINGFERWLASYNFLLDTLSFMWFHYRRDVSLEDIILEDWNDITILCECSDFIL